METKQAKQPSSPEQPGLEVVIPDGLIPQYERDAPLYYAGDGSEAPIPVDTEVGQGQEKSVTDAPRTICGFRRRYFWIAVVVVAVVVIAAAVGGGVGGSLANKATG